MKTRILKNKDNIIYAYYMIRRSRYILLLLFILITACSSSKAVLIYYSGNFHGVLEDCNCPKVSDGSILNHITFYRDSIRNDRNKIYICTGNIYSYSYGDKENKIIGEIIDRLGYDYIAVGRNESGFYKDINKKMKTASLNIDELPEYCNFKINNFRIFITSITDPSFSKYSADSHISELNIRSIKQHTDSLKNMCDVLIVVSNLESSSEKMIFNQAESIDIMVSNTNSKKEMLRFGNRLYISHGQNAENIGKLELTQHKNEFKYENTFIKMSSDIFKDDPDIKESVDSLKKINGIKIRNSETDY